MTVVLVALLVFAAAMTEDSLVEAHHLDQARAVCETVAEPDIALSLRGVRVALGSRCGQPSERCSFGTPDPETAARLLDATGASSLEFATMPVWGAHVFVEVALSGRCPDGSEPGDCLSVRSERPGRVDGTDMAHPPPWPCFEFSPLDIGPPCEAESDVTGTQRLISAMDWSTDYVLFSEEAGPEFVGDLQVEPTVWTVRSWNGGKAVWRARQLRIAAVLERTDRRLATWSMGQCGLMLDGLQFEDGR